MVPVVALTVAIAVLTSLHEPPVVASDNVIDCPIQTEEGPVGVEGNGFTVTTVVVMQPEPSE